MLFESFDNVYDEIIRIDDFLKFIEDNDSEQLLGYLSIQNEDDQSLISVMLSQKGSIEILSKLEDKLQDKLYSSNFNGDNILNTIYLVMCNDDINYLLSEHTDKFKFLKSNLNKLSTSSDYSNIFPIQILHHRGKEINEDTLKLAIAYTKSKLPEIHDEITLDSVQSSIDLNSHSKEFLKIAINIMNKARSQILASSSLNLLNLHIVNNAAFKLISSKMDNFNEKRDSVYSNKTSDETYLKEMRKIYYELFDSLTNHANCHEIANYVSLLFEKNNLPISCETFSIKGGNHAFNVINRLQDSIPSNPRTWGDECYIIDAWSSNILNAQDYYNKMKGFATVQNKDEIIFFLHNLTEDRHIPKLDTSSQTNHYPDNQRLKF